MQTVSVAARYESVESLARSWNRRRGILAVGGVSIREGTRVLVDGSAGDAQFLVRGDVVALEVNGPSIQLLPEGREELEDLFSSNADEWRRTRERWPVQIPGILSGRDLVRCADLSTGGAKLIFGRAEAPPVGTLIHLALFPGDVPVIPAPILAHIAWRSDDGRVAGCTFRPGSASTVLAVLRRGAQAACAVA